VGLDLETTGLDPRADRVRLLTVSVDTVDGQQFSYLIDCFAIDPATLFPALAAAHLVIHNAAFDLAFLAQLGFTPGRHTASMILSQGLYNGALAKGAATGRHGLQDAAAP